MKVIKILVITLFFSFAAFSLEMGSLNGKMPVVKGKAPVHTSKYFVATGEFVNGKAVFNVPISSKNAMVVLLGTKADSVSMDYSYKLKARIFNTPDLEAMEVPRFGTKVDVNNVDPGYHNFVFFCKAKNRGVAQIVVSEPDSSVALRLSVSPLSATVGDDVVIKANLGNEVSSVNTMVKAIVKGYTELNLKDDGVYPDEVKGDGIFTGSIIADSDKSFEPEMVKVVAIGITKDKKPFMRNGTASFMVTKPTTYIDGNIVDNGNSIVVPLAPAKGKFRVEVIFGNDDDALAYVRDDIELNNNSANLVLPKPAKAFQANRAIVRVLNLETLGVEAEKAVAIRQLVDFNRERFLLKKAKVKKPVLPKSKVEAAKRYGDEPENSELK